MRGTVFRHGNSALPPLHKSFVHPGADVVPETVVAGGEVLRAVIEGVVAVTAGSHASTGATCLVEDVNLEAVIGERTGCYESGEARTDDRC